MGGGGWDDDDGGGGGGRGKGKRGGGKEKGKRFEGRGDGEGASVVGGMEAIPFFDYRVPECHRPTNYARSRSPVSQLSRLLPSHPPSSSTKSMYADDETNGHCVSRQEPRVWHPEYEMIREYERGMH